MRPGSGSCAGNDVSYAISVDVSCRNIDAAQEVCVVSKKALQQIQIRSFKNLYVWSPSRTGGSNDVCSTIAINVTGSNTYPAGEPRRVSEEAAEDVAASAVEYANDGWSSLIRTDYDVGFAIAINITGGNIYATLK